MDHHAVCGKKITPAQLRTNPSLFMGYIQVTSKFCIVSSCSNPHIGWLNPHGLPFPFLIIKRWVKSQSLGEIPVFLGCRAQAHHAATREGQHRGRDQGCQEENGGARMTVGK
jgi:hypothetical protein